jgi:hypothetical protein
VSPVGSAAEDLRRRSIPNPPLAGSMKGEKEVLVSSGEGR